MADTVFEIPRLRTMARHAVPNVLEGTVIPLLVFLAFLKLVGIVGAMIAGLVWAYGAILRRVLRRQRIAGLLVLSAVGLTARTVIGLATGSVVLYFIQPTVGTFLVGTAFLLSVPLGRPLAEKLARDFFPMDPETLADRRVRRFFCQISLLWCVSNLVNAALTLWLLLDHSLTVYLLFRSTISPVLTAAVVALSFGWFRISMARSGIAVRVAQGGRSGALLERVLGGRRRLPLPLDG